MAADFALRLTGLRPIERAYGSATSGANKAAPARSLSGTKESGRQNCARPAGNSEADKSEAQEAGRGVSETRLTFLGRGQFCERSI
jgi:hypothetical protein